VGAQNARNWTAIIVIDIEPKSAQIGGSRAPTEVEADRGG
jgi:hypothetical protein